MIVLPTPAGILGFNWCGGTGLFVQNLIQNCRDVLAAKRLLARGHSYSITPREKISVRPSTALPLICSGDM